MEDPYRKFAVTIDCTISDLEGVTNVILELTEPPENADQEWRPINPRAALYAANQLSGIMQKIRDGYSAAVDANIAADLNPDPHIEWVREYRALSAAINASSEKDELAGHVDALEAQQDALVQKIVGTPPKTREGVRALCEAMEAWRAIGDLWSDGRDKKAWDLIKAAI